MNNLNILYEDNHIIVVIKPLNILSQGDNTKDPDMLTIIKEYLKEKYHKPGNVYLGLVHRLDRPTSGIMVFAKTSKAASRLSEEIRNKKFIKGYLAVVHGHIKEQDTFIDYLKKDDENNSLITSKEDGNYAELSYQLLEYNKEKDLSLVKVNLITGRHHQIRVQFAHRGYPLYGDNRYNKEKKKNLGLYAYYLSFTHPTKKERLEWINYPKYSPFNYFKN